ncbi:MAG: ATP/GTP-binding protein [Methylococcaceae bacterium]
MKTNALHQSKFVFTGSVGAGKTTAIATISEVTPITTEVKPSEESIMKHKNTTTVAMDYGELTLDYDHKLYLYGTPGQRRFDFMSQILTEGALGLVILINNAHETPMSELDYYLNLNAKFLTSYAAVIGITHYDETDKPSVADYYAVLKERGEHWPVIHADARKIEDVTRLLTILLATIEYAV